MSTTAKVGGQEIIKALTEAEVDGAFAPDARRVLRDERLAVQGAMQSAQAAAAALDRAEKDPGPMKTVNGRTVKDSERVIRAEAALETARNKVGAAIVEATRVARMWGVEV